MVLVWVCSPLLMNTKKPLGVVIGVFVSFKRAAWVCESCPEWLRTLGMDKLILQ